MRPHEFFTFATSDAEEAGEREVSENALRFTRGKPFLFQDRRVGTQLSRYAQDVFSPVQKVTVTAGLRYDRSTLPTIEDQFSPRIGAGYYISKTRTALRGSFSRLYMPPQIENLLLANSEEAREFPNSVAEGFARGTDARIKVPDAK